MQRGVTSVRSRYPLGVVVVAAIAALRGLTILAALANVGSGGILDWFKEGSPLPEFRPGSDAEIIARILLAGLLAASVLVVVGLVLRRRWAWVLAIVTSGLILAIDLGWWYGGEARYGSMFLNVIAVFYLNQRDVRVSLRGGSAEP
jgi:hypothetical protein